MGNPSITVLYGTQTGNSLDVAKRISREATSYGLNPIVQSLHSYDVMKLPSEKLLLFVVATTGQGDVPDKVKSFWKFLFKKSLSERSLIGSVFAVFGLGDSAYVKYNVVAKKLHNRLISLGARAIINRGLGDDQAEDGYETALDPWLETLWNKLTTAIDLQPPVDKPTIGHCPYSVEIINEDDEHQPETYIDWFKHSTNAARLFYELEDGQVTHGNTPSERMPFFASILKNERITSMDHFQDTRHLVLNISESGLAFRPGDVLAMHPLTSWDAVDAFIRRLGMDPMARIALRHKASQLEHVTILRSLVQGVMDVACASPRRFLFEVLSHFASEESEKERLRFFSSSQGREELTIYNKQSGRTVLEVLNDFPSAMPPLEWLLEACPRKSPRRFSIASSLEVYPNEVHLTVAIVEYRTKNRRVKHGLCTSFLGQLQAGTAEGYVPCWIEHGSLNFKSAENVPLLLIGPGTGVAPFRSVLQERNALLAKDSSYRPPPAYLFFGCRNESADFYYADEWTLFKESGILDKELGLITAFSRDQKEKIYVTHKIAEHGAFISDLLLNKDATVFVAGSANKMPKDVHMALIRALEVDGQLVADDAKAFIKRLEQQGKYQVESWS